jgi:hypothetical protein
MSHLRLVQPNEVIERNETRKVYLIDFAKDVAEFARDLASCTARIIVAWKVMLAMACGEELAFSTSLLLGGLPIFEKSTNWMKRTRIRIKKVIRNIY